MPCLSQVALDLMQPLIHAAVLVFVNLKIYHVISKYLSCHVMSCPVTPHHMTSQHMTSHDKTPYQLMAHHTMHHNMYV